MSPLLFALVLFAQPAAPTTQSSFPKPATVTREEWGSKPNPIDDKCKHTPKYITIHHGGVAWKTGRDPAEFVRAVQKWGQRRASENAALPPDKQKKNVEDWPDLPYHYMIAPDGRIFECRPLEYEPQSNTNYSLQGHIGVELMGSFGMQRPSQKQFESLVAIVTWLCQDLKISPDEIAGHKDRAVDQTTCPGKDIVRYLDNGQFKTWVKDSLAAGKLVEIDLGPPLPGGPTVIIDTPTTQPQ